jgi:iron complex outermembrane receptor protein
MRTKIARWQLLLLIFFLGSFTLSQAQEITVSGTVSDEADGTTLIGVAIIQKGTSIGTTTDLDGKYTITVQKGSTLVYSYIGYEEAERIADYAAIDIKLKAKSELLDEVLVIGYGTQKKTDKTGAVSNVQAEELNQGVLSDPIQGLQGKAAGVTITKKGGDPNAGFAVRIRGSSGFDSNTQPLFVVDGVPGVDPTIIASEDIESYNILKDAASTAIYGSRGANGVIIITTKKGKIKNGEAVSNVNFNTKYSVDRVANTVNMMDASQIRSFAVKKYADSIAANPGSTVNDYFIDGGANTNWQDEIYRTGITTDNNLSFSGGSNKSTYMASITHSDWQGVMKGTEKERTSARMNINHKAFDDKLTLSANLATTFENNDYENYGGFNKDDIIYQALTRNPTDPVLNADGGYDKTQRTFNYENPVAVINEITNVRDAKRYMGNLKADAEILSGLIATASISYIRNDAEYTYFRPKGVFASADNGYGRRSYSNEAEKMIETYVNYTKVFKENHNLNLMAGYSWREKTFDGLYAQAENSQSPYIGANDLRTFVDVHYGDVGSYKSMERLIGFYGRALYNYKSKYYLSASLRRDGSTKFGANNKWGWFPTASLGWSIHNEDFMSNITWIDQLKLRASYGVSGNQEIGIGNSQVSWEPSGIAINPEDGSQVISFAPARNENDDLKWEKTTEINLGLDFAFLSSKISGSLEVYNKKTSDLLGRYIVSVPPNLARTTYKNSGSIDNKGIELYVQAFVVNKNNFTYKTSFTVAHNKSEFTDLGERTTDNSGIRHDGYISGRGAVGEGYYLIGIAEGQEVSSFYLPSFATTADGQVKMIDGQFVYRSVSGGYTTQMADAQRSFVGSANPDIELGWSNNFTFYKNWSVDFAFRSMIGNKKYNATKMFFDSPLDLPDLNAMTEAIDWYDKNRATTAVVSDIYLEDASFVKLDFISLGYSVNTKNIKWLDKLKLFVVANNVLTITGYSGADPETYMSGLAYGIDQYNVYPKTKSFTFGINASF